VVEEKEETEVVSVPTLPSGEPVVEPAESDPAELEDDALPVTGGAFPKEPEPVIADLVAAELEVAPEPIEAVTVVFSAESCAFIHS